jgi:hypothetical protein
VVPIQAAVHHGQHVFGQFIAAGPDDFLEPGVSGVEEILGEVHRVAEAHLEILADGLDGVLLSGNRAEVPWKYFFSYRGLS